MTQKFVKMIAVGSYDFNFAPTTTTFDIVNNSTFNVDVSFGKSSGLSDIYLHPQGGVRGYNPTSAKYSTGGVKWQGIIHVTVTQPLGGNDFPAQGVAQELTIYGYETGYNLGSSFAMNNASQPTNIDQQLLTQTVTTAFSNTGGNSAINPGPLGYAFLSGFTITASPNATVVSGLLTLSNILGLGGNLYYNFSIGTLGLFMTYNFPRSLQNIPGSQIVANINNIGAGPGEILTLYGYNF